MLYEQNHYESETFSHFQDKVLSEQARSDVEHDLQIVGTYHTPEQRQVLHYYKCYVGKGNNAILIRSLFKSRYWWFM